MPARCYLICTSPRTGSTLLTEALKLTGRAGRPAEYFDIHDVNEAFWIRHLRIGDPAEYVDKVLEAGTTANGTFGLKLHWHQSTALRAKLLLALGSAPHDEHADLEALIRCKIGQPQYVWLQRQNKVAQAISYYRAAQTGIWRSTDFGNDSDPGLQFDFDQIDYYVGLLRDFDSQWQDYFQSRHAQPLIISYEALVEAYESTVRRVLGYLGVPHEDMTISPPQLARQADARSSEWERRYEEIKQGQSKLGASAAKALSIRARKSVPATAKNSPSSNSHPATNGGDDGPPLIAYALNSEARFPIVAGRPSRRWMDNLPKRFAYRCLPMVIANQAGWLICNPQKVAVKWTGAADIAALEIDWLGAAAATHAKSHFGFGILTFTTNYLFRTPPGYNLLVRGPANYPKDGIAPLEGIVEADWIEATFTINWQLTRTDHWVTFEQEEPIAMVVPMRRRELEQFRPEILGISADPALKAGHDAWSRSRTQFNIDLKTPNSRAQLEEWQRHYSRGTTVTERHAPEHQTKLLLKEFVDRRP